MKIKLAIFDMDGTVFESYLNWKQIKKKLNIKSGNILREIYRDNDVDTEKLKILENHEQTNALKTKPINGISNFLLFLNSNKIKTALITNNSRKNTQFLLNKFNLNFNKVITREMKLWKPDPGAFFYVMRLFNCNSSETMSIGDSHYDVVASQKANISALFIIKDKRKQESLHKKEFDTIFSNNTITFFSNYYELKKILQERFRL